MPNFLKQMSSASSSLSLGPLSSDEDTDRTHDEDFPSPVLVYHSRARSIVFPDHIRRAALERERDDDPSHHGEGVAPSQAKGAAKRTPSLTSQLFPSAEDTVLLSKAGVPESQIGGFQPRVTPLPSLVLGPRDEFEPLLNQPDFSSPEYAADWTSAEKEVVRMLEDQRACVKTVKNTDWTSFLKRFKKPAPRRSAAPTSHDDQPPVGNSLKFNSFVTSTTLLPPGGNKMRTYGSTNQFTVGAVFALPDHVSDQDEDEQARRTQTWSWPAGYCAKTEFNIDGNNGRLINGRGEALCPLFILREYNKEYLTGEEYTVSMRRVSGLSQIPYNEVFLRVGGVDTAGGGAAGLRSFENGVGLPVALFVRSAKFADLVTLLRTRARLVHSFGRERVGSIPLLLICPDLGVRVLSRPLQEHLWKIMASNLNPFQTTDIAHLTKMERTSDEAFRRKIDELLDLDDEIVRQTLTPKERLRVAGGFGATDNSLTAILQRALLHDWMKNEQDKALEGNSTSHRLKDCVTEGLAYAVRSRDYHTARQLLILYSVVASNQQNILEAQANTSEAFCASESTKCSSELDDSDNSHDRLTMMDTPSIALENGVEATIKTTKPPPPLDTGRLRRATNCDGLLAVLGAAQVLKSLQDGKAQERVEESIAAIEEWVGYGEQSMTFRLSSWMDQKAAQGDLKIATREATSMMAFVSTKAVTNRKIFAQKLREANDSHGSELGFLARINELLLSMHSPCLRLELLQYIFGLDNRYSVAQLTRCLELAGTCLFESSPNENHHDE